MSAVFLIHPCSSCRVDGTSEGGGASGAAELDGEHGGGRVGNQRGGRRGGQLDSVSTRWRIRTIRRTSHAEAVDVRHNQTPPLR